MKKIYTSIIALIMAAGMTGSYAQAYDPADNVAEGSYGENLVWSLNGEGTLTISGTGAMESSGASPWEDNTPEIKTLVIKDGISYIDLFTFNRCTSLENVILEGNICCTGFYTEI